MNKKLLLLPVIIGLLAWVNPQKGLTNSSFIITRATGIVLSTPTTHLGLSGGGELMSVTYGTSTLVW